MYVYWLTFFSFNKCYSAVLEENKALQNKKAHEKGALPVGPYARFNNSEMNSYIKRFPLSDRKAESRYYIHPEFRKWSLIYEVFFWYCNYTQAYVMSKMSEYILCY